MMLCHDIPECDKAAPRRMYKLSTFTCSFSMYVETLCSLIFSRYQKCDTLLRLQSVSVESLRTQQADAGIYFQVCPHTDEATNRNDPNA